MKPTGYLLLMLVLLLSLVSEMSHSLMGETQLFLR